MTSIPYERIVQWLSGPVSIVAGWAAAQLTTHVGIFGTLGLGKNQIAHAILDVGTFAIGALVTYAAHQKWLTNLAKWWETTTAAPLTAVPAQLPDDAGTEQEIETSSLTIQPESAVKPDVEATG